MKVALTIEITDAQRNVLANLDATKRTKKLASRDDVRDFIVGVLSNLTPDLLLPEQPKQAVDKSKKFASYDVGDNTTITIETGADVQSNYETAFLAALSDTDLATYNRLKEEGHSSGYIRGYFYIERKKQRGDKPLRDKDVSSAGGSTQNLRNDDRSIGEDKEGS